MQEWKASEKEAQKMTRDGAISVKSLRKGGPEDDP